MIALDQILRIPMLPILMAQGLATRKSALILPEPEGPRAGLLGDGPPIRVLLAGDSSAAGVGVEHQSQALSGQLARRLAQHFQVSWQLEATTGHQTRDTLERLNRLPTQTFDVVVLALGVNDVTHGTSRRRFAREQAELFAMLSDKFLTRVILASGVPQMQHFPALPQPLAWVLGRQATRLDSVYAPLQEQFENLIHLPFFLPQDPELAAEDGYHPSAKAYALWADILAERITHHLN